MTTATAFAAPRTRDPAGPRTDPSSASVSRMPLNHQVFDQTDAGELVVNENAARLLQEVTRIEMLLPGQVYAVHTPTYGVRRLGVQISPRLLCRCLDTTMTSGVCGHVAAALLASGSEHIDAASETQYRMQTLLAPSDRSPERVVQALGGAREKLAGGDTSGEVMRMIALDPSSGLPEWRGLARMHPNRWNCAICFSPSQKRSGTRRSRPCC